MALSALLMAHFRQSKRRTALFLQAILNQPCSAGWVVKLQRWATAALRPSYEQLVAALPAEPLLGGDETATKEAHHKAWLWTFVAKHFTVFTIRPSRAATTIRELLGVTFGGVVSCDRARMYFQVPRLQWCWAHLKRDFQALIDSPDGEAQQHGRELMQQTNKLFNLWRDCRKGTLSRGNSKRGCNRFARRWKPCSAGVRRAGMRAWFRSAGTVEAPRATLEISGCGRSGADQQSQRACLAPRRHLAKAVVWDTECGRQSVRGNDAQRD